MKICTQCGGADGYHALNCPGGILFSNQQALDNAMTHKVKNEQITARLKELRDEVEAERKIFLKYGDSFDAARAGRQEVFRDRLSALIAELEQGSEVIS